MRFGKVGSADIIGVKDGRMVAIEAKSEKGRQSESQRAFQQRLESEGGFYVLARSVDDVVKAGL